ncbi:hypothetical protein M2454_001413 [Aequitasia blattaphilus]|uniref:Uncharacterized protein n=1 Tax=Aequitasia blattaphilus TaxID=2949332 RepID=A0ABT1EER4_9FIRM|nr:hypothetical protein [Aequitasia blattaphilus]MCP1103326.1 hypothetical protein [Aequitasia blattaphilus]MCR8615966.1 hypothetical protein [Aequitasia blattaphilus]
MGFGWINFINGVAVTCLIIINIIAVRKNIAGSFSSKYHLINIFEQIGRYGCMVFMIIPLAVPHWQFGFSSVKYMILWFCLTVVLLTIYAVLWTTKTKGKKETLYGLAIVPVCLFLMNGILLRHIFLTAFSLLFGFCHLLIVKENT